MTSLWFRQALLPGGWAAQVRVRIAAGKIDSMETGTAPASGDACFATGLPGLPNLHSHAFQRLMAGLAETRGGPDGDDFWSWRDLMYRLVRALSPDDVSAIASMAYVEMLESGFTRVGEFHYLHHQPDGRAYGNPAEMAVAIAQAAEDTGIGLTLLPVFYAHAGFGGQTPHDGQRRFICDLDGFAALRQHSIDALACLPDAIVGTAPHSLRAVTPVELRVITALGLGAPIHIHIAEQVKEVADCIAWSGQRPVQWLFDHHDVGPAWCLVHATHVDAREMTHMVASQAIVGLCPITEANLGDGIFPAADFDNAGGRFGIGSDSNVRIDAAEELRLLEYGQRLSRRQRSILAAAGGSNGRHLFDRAVEGGHQALGTVSALRVGDSADIVALRDDPLDREDCAIDRWIFGNGRIHSVWRAGRHVVADGRHLLREQVERRYAATARRLIAQA